VLYVEAEDFQENPAKDFFRLAPGREVRLKQAYFVKCNDVVKDPASGKVVELRCTYDPDTRGGTPKDGRKVKATIHWVSAQGAVTAEVRLYEPLFSAEDPSADEGKSLAESLNPNSLVTLRGCQLEASIREAKPGTHLQFLRHGYFFVDPVDSKPGAPVFNRVVTLKDSYGKGEKRR
jgi:glutaminyl-tRNA synthetase